MKRFMSRKTAELSQFPVQAAEAELGRDSAEESPEDLCVFLSACSVLTFPRSTVSTVETNVPIASQFL